jgi:hypothetical protein
MVTATREIEVALRKPHPKQIEFIRSKAKRRIIKAGRRGGKTVGIAILAVEAFLDGHRVLYAAPTSEQTDAFWYEVTGALQPMIDAKLVHIDNNERFIERVGTKNRIRAKTAWNADTLRGDYADLLIFDEYQLTNEDAWEVVGAPMLLDNNGDAVFIYTPPSLRSTGVSKARDPRHASKLFATAKSDTSGRWAAFHFTTFDNPHVSQIALADITKDMTQDAYRKEILAMDEEIEDSWLVYPFNTRVCKIEPFPIPKTWFEYSGHDFGSANTAALFLALDPMTGNKYFHREYMAGKANKAQQVAEFQQFIESRKILYSAGGSHQEDDSRTLYGQNGWPIQEPNIPGVKPQVDRVRDMMRNNKVYVFNTLIGYLDELTNCLWKLDEHNKPTNEIDGEARFHFCACARYILSYFPLETVITGAGRKAVSNS